MDTARWARNGATNHEGTQEEQPCVTGLGDDGLRTGRAEFEVLVRHPRVETVVVKMIGSEVTMSPLTRGKEILVITL